MLDILKVIQNGKKRILVLGDTIYDNYIMGEVLRMSPEAPVPILTPNKFEFKLGGAANVFNVINSFRGNVQLCTLIGNDIEGQHIKNTLIGLDNDPSLIFVDESRITTKKTRLIKSNGSQLLRIDCEDVSPIHKDLLYIITKVIREIVDQFDILVISDYAKGLVTDDLASIVIDIFRDKSKIVLTDPKSSCIEKYKNSYLIKPNLNEFNKFVASSRFGDSMERLISHGEILLKKSNAEYIYVTLGKKGGLLIGRSIKAQTIPAYGKSVVDITGAGDTVIAAIALALAADIELAESVRFASYAAGVCVGKIGASTFDTCELQNLMQKEGGNEQPIQNHVQSAPGVL